MKTVTKIAATKTSRRIATIQTELANLSRGGWRHARPCDYQPLEAELRELQTGTSSRRAGAP